jgi:hypothetical protein
MWFTVGQGGLKAVKKILTACGIALIAYGAIEWSLTLVSVLGPANLVERYLTGFAAIWVGPLSLAAGVILLMWIYRKWGDD